jgi:hypothetical protein
MILKRMKHGWPRDFLKLNRKGEEKQEGLGWDGWKMWRMIYTRAESEEVETKGK